ncbi:MAG: glycosyltransferase family 4 protein [Maritimibacter harenae]
MSVLFIAPFPPDFTGQSISSTFLAGRLEQDDVRLRRMNTNGTRPGQRARRLAWSLLACLLTRHRTVYLSVNANRGMWVTACQAALARLRGKRVVLHHHTNAHLRHERPAARTLVRAAGDRAAHIVICDVMAEDLRALYAPMGRCLSLSNVGVVAGEAVSDPSPPRGGRQGGVTLGHLSNLTVEKGCLRAIDAFKAAHAKGLAARLVLAGPIRERKLQRRVAAEVRASGGAITYVGPVYGAAKRDFFTEIDVFLFPSLYPNETQGIVNLEALAAGCPVIAFGQCCIASDLDDPSSRTVPMDADFSEATIAFLETMDLHAMSVQARARYETLLADSHAQYEAVRDLLADAAPG